jgi:hypothetical protein
MSKASSLHVKTAIATALLQVIVNKCTLLCSFGGNMHLLGGLLF